MKRVILIAASLLFLPALPGLAGEIGYIEEFALAKDREAALKQLIPGTEDYYYYYCLHCLNTEQFERAEQLLRLYIKHHGYTPRVREIEARKALLTYSRSPQKTVEYLVRTLKLHFNHQREAVGARPDLPTALNQDLISPKRLMQDALARWKNLDGFEDHAIPWLVSSPLSPERRRYLLQRLQRPDYPKLVQLILDDLNFKGSRGFGSLPVHHMLLVDQLDKCVELKPDLLNQTQFVNTYLSKLKPCNDVDWKSDPGQRRAHLERLWKFVQQLAPTHNSLKAHVLYHRLVLDRSQGIYDKARFMAYIQLPRVAPYANPKYIADPTQRHVAINLNADFHTVTLLPAVGNDEPVVHSYLQHFFLAETTRKRYEPYLSDIYLKHVFAETKIVHALGDAEQWSTMLPPEQFQALKQRVDLDFAFTNKQSFAASEPVRLDLFVKNVPTLIVKVFEINTFNYYQQNNHEVDTDVNLDGLVANQEKTERYTEPPLRRVVRHFEFPELSRSGVYVIDFIGNGKSSRAVIQKGRLHYLVRNSIAGHVFTILDEQNKKLTDASLWMAGHQYKADNEGAVTVPFSTRPGPQSILLTHDGCSTLESFDHQAEAYRLVAGIYVDRESLLARKRTKVVIRPSLLLSGTPVSLAILEQVTLVITSFDHDNVATTKEVPDFKLSDERESVFEFQVPQRLQRIQFTLKAKVQVLSENKKRDLSFEQAFVLNKIDQTDKIESAHLERIGPDYVLELVGKTGEPEAHRPVRISIKHRDFRRPAEVMLQTDDVGHISLGRLTDVQQLTAIGPDSVSHSWTLLRDQHSYNAALQGAEGKPLEIPYMGTDTELSRGRFSLLEVRDGQFVADDFDALQLQNGLLTVNGLPGGDYDLWINETATRIRIQITAGPVREGYALGKYRQLELRGANPLQISKITTDDERIHIQLSNTSPSTRLHLFATRYEPAYPAFEYLSRVRDAEPNAFLFLPGESRYVAGRNIGDEYRYIIDRKYSTRLPGNMLQRPSLLLNPWALRKTETTRQQAGKSQAYGGVGARNRNAAKKRAAKPHEPQQRGDFANLDFLANGTALQLNLIPDKNGLVTIARKELGPHQRLWIVAVDRDDTICRGIAVTKPPRKFNDLRLTTGLDPTKHFAQQKQINAVPAEMPFQLADITTARIETYDSLAKVYSLLATLANNPTLTEFAFVVDWDKLTAEQKRSKYSKYACHELNYFLFRKDPPFFAQTILPYLKNKKDKKFLDHWLVGDKLGSFLEPWKYDQLNVVERILLAQRITGEQHWTVQHVTDSLNLIPPDTSRFNFLFETALKGTALDTDDVLKLGAALREVEDLVVKEESEKALAKRPAAPPAPAQAADSKAPKQAMDDVLAESMNRGAGRPRDRSALSLESKRKLNVNKDLMRRAKVRQLFMKLDKTQEWAENNYYHLPIEAQKADLIRVNAFWRDLARHDSKKPFYSTYFAEASHSFPEAMFALASLDLPMHSHEHKTTFDGKQMTLIPGSPMIVFHEEIKEAKLASEATPILVSQNFFRQGDRYRYVGNQRMDKYVTDEFLIQTVYGCQVVVTNPTSSPQKLDLLLQVPQGAIPVLKSHVTRSVHIDLQPFHTQTLEYYFYFPYEGEFQHYPVHVSRNETLLAFATPVVLSAVKQLSKVDKESWDYVSQFGSNEAVLKFLTEQNLQRIKLDRIAFRMQDKPMFLKVIDLLSKRHIYNHLLWSYGLRHNVPAASAQYLQHEPTIVQRCGAELTSPLLVIDPVARKTYQHLDYRPLVNARAHKLGRKPQIVNQRLLQQYQKLLKILSYQRQLTNDQRMAVIYYLLVQDRVEQASEMFQAVDPEKLDTRLQYDYFAAYLDFYTDDPKVAGPIAERYADYPVDRWRIAFQAIATQLKEIQGDANVVVDPEDRTQKQTGLAASSPTFDFSVDVTGVSIDYQNLDQVRVNYYLMDIELLFSRNPFVQQYSGQFSSIHPNQSAIVKLPKSKRRLTFKLPEDLRNKNVLIEIQGAGQTRSKAYYANRLSVQLIETYGQMRVVNRSTGRPISKVYIKVYARMNDGNVRFYKDGYTDLRGRFDYTSLNTNELDSVKKFAILVYSDENGSVVREADPPKR